MPDETEPVVETPTLEGAPATPAQLTPETTPTPAVEGAAPSPPAAAEGQPPAPAEPPQFFEAIVDGKPFQIPRSAQFPWKRGDESGLMALDEFVGTPMRLKDYTQKTQAVAEQQRRIAAREQELQRLEVEHKARIESAKSNRQRLVEAAAQGGEAFQRELEHQQRMETDEDYRQRYEESEEWRIHQALEQHDEATARAAHAETVLERTRAYIAEACARHPGVDPRRIERLYGQALTAGQADLTQRDVDALITEELRVMQSAANPLKGELDTVKQELAALKAQLGAAQHNERTSAAITRATGNAPGKPANGAPPAPAARKPFDPTTDNEADWIRNWLKEGQGATA